MKSILVFNDSMEMGGTEKLLVDMLNNLCQKYRITLLLPQPSDNNVLLEKVNSAVEIKYIYASNASRLNKKIGESLMIFFPRIFSWTKGLKTSRYDKIICFKECFYARALSASKAHKILWIHNILYKRHYEIRSLKERLAVWLNKKQISVVQRSYDKYNTVVCVSDSCLKFYLDVLYEGKMPNQDIRIIYNAIDLSRAEQLSKESIEDLPRDRTNFILITRSSPEKRTDRLINAATKLQQEGYNFHVNIIGDGLDSVEMKAMLKARNLEESISLLGRIDNPFPYILQSDWLLCVSERESFSLTLLEAMALKTPVITTNCGGPYDIVNGGEHGVLVENSGKGVYEGMKKVMDDSSLSHKYNSRLDEALHRFDYIHWHKSIEKLLEE